jgi:hypothetical protein
MRVAASNGRITTLVLSFAALLVMACSDSPLAPSAVAGTYVLLSIDGRALPTSSGSTGPADEPLEVVADTLRLNLDGTGSRVRVQRIMSGASMGEWTPLRGESALHYATTGSGIAVTFDCPPNALMLCAAGPHMAARFSAPELIATPLSGEPRQELVYARVERLD